ncbi:bifunctional glutamate--cysteine ligase GshA/glutathione synthetase GshB, partial [Colwellia ponticola]
IWPLSMPPVLPSDETTIPIADVAPDARAYRDYLANRYGRRLQMISGVHFNFSLAPALIARLYDEVYHDQFATVKDFSDMLYLQIAQNYSQYRYLLTYLFGASPITEALFQTDTTNLPDYAVRSLRSSQLFGYAN